MISTESADLAREPWAVAGLGVYGLKDKFYADGGCGLAVVAQLFRRSPVRTLVTNGNLHFLGDDRVVSCCLLNKRENLTDVCSAIRKKKIWWSMTIGPRASIARQCHQLASSIIFLLYTSQNRVRTIPYMEKRQQRANRHWSFVS
jgi:hypothetical protein